MINIRRHLEVSAESEEDGNILERWLHPGYVIGLSGDTLALSNKPRNHGLCYKLCILMRFQCPRDEEKLWV